MKFCVLGLGRFGYHVATRLADNGMEVLGVDKDEAIVASIKDQVTQAICLDIRDENSLRSIGIEEMDTAIVAMGENFAGSILITTLLKKKLAIPQVITRAINDIHKEILLLIGADRIILPEKEIGTHVADTLSVSFNVLSRLSKKFSISQLPVPESFIGKTVKKLALHEHYHVTYLGLKKGNDIFAITKDYQISAGDILILAGTNKDLETLAKL